MAGVRVSESTVERTTEDAGAAGRGVGAGDPRPASDWPWHKDYQGKTCAYVELDATRHPPPQGEHGGPGEGRMAYVGMVCNPGPEWPWPDEKPAPMRARYLSGLSPLEAFAPLLRSPAGAVGMDRADRRIGLSDGGSGLEDRLRENFPRVEAIILDFFHPAEKPTGLARRLHPDDEARAEEQARRWCALLKPEGGAVLSAVLEDWDWRARPGLGGGRRAGRLPGPSRASDGYPEYLAGAGASAAARSGVGVQDGGGAAAPAGRQDAQGRKGAHAVCHLRAPVPEREGSVGSVLEPRLQPQLIKCPTN